MYDSIPFDKQEETIRECYALVSKRSDSVCNFLEGSKAWGSDVRLIYRHYATLYFIFAVDESESELGILDLIQVFVESLDKSFENVCELDLIFHPDKVSLAGATVARVAAAVRFAAVFLSWDIVILRSHLIVPALPLNFPAPLFSQVNLILDEIIMAGMVLETSLKEIVKTVAATDKFEKATKSASQVKATLLPGKLGVIKK